MIIKPYSALATESQNIATDFAFVKHLFKCNEAAGTTTITDSVGDLVISSGALTKPNANSVQLPVTTSVTTSGTQVAASGKFPVVFAVAEFSNTANFKIGTSAQYVNLKTSNPTVSDTPTGATSIGTTYTLTTAATIYGRAFVVNAYNTATGLQTYQFNTTDTATALATTPSDATATPGGIALTDFAGIGTGASGFQFAAAAPIYGICVMYFTTIPSNLKAGLAWMTYQWSIGNKVIYPGFKGLS